MYLKLFQYKRSARLMYWKKYTFVLRVVLSFELI